MQITNPQSCLPILPFLPQASIFLSAFSEINKGSCSLKNWHKGLS